MSNAGQLITSYWKAGVEIYHSQHTSQLLWGVKIQFCHQANHSVQAHSAYLATRMCLVYWILVIKMTNMDEVRRGSRRIELPGKNSRVKHVTHIYYSKVLVNPGSKSTYNQHADMLNLYKLGVQVVPLEMCFTSTLWSKVKSPWYHIFSWTFST